MWLVAVTAASKTRTKTTKASRAVGTVRWWRSLYGPCHALSGIGLSPGMMPAPPVTAPTTSALAHLALWLTRGARARAEDAAGYPGSGGHSHDVKRNSNTRGHVVSVAISFHATTMTCAACVAGESHSLVDAHSRRRHGSRSTCPARARPRRQRRWA